MRVNSTSSDLMERLWCGVRLRRSSDPSVPYPLLNMVVVMSSAGVASHRQVWIA